MGPTWGPSWADRIQVGPMLAPWTLLSGRSLSPGPSFLSLAQSEVSCPLLAIIWTTADLWHLNQNRIFCLDNRHFKSCLQMMVVCASLSPESSQLICNVCAEIAFSNFLPNLPPTNELKHCSQNEIGVCMTLLNTFSLIIFCVSIQLQPEVVPYCWV